MESATFRKWLIDRGCRIERHPPIRHRKKGFVTVLVRRDDRTADLPFAGSRKHLPEDVVNEIVTKLGLNPAELPGPQGRA